MHSRRKTRIQAVLFFTLFPVASSQAAALSGRKIFFMDARERILLGRI